jgi:hypothetical protein
VATALHEELWNVPLASILDETSDNSGQKIRYVSCERVEKLKLRVMNYIEEVLLIRKEYDVALKLLQFRASSKSRGGGVVVSGQPGIGM